MLEKEKWFRCIEFGVSGDIQMKVSWFPFKIWLCSLENWFENEFINGRKILVWGGSNYFLQDYFWDENIARGGVGEDLEIMVIGIIKTKNEIVSTINLLLREGQGQSVIGDLHLRSNCDFSRQKILSIMIKAVGILE